MDRDDPNRSVIDDMLAKGWTNDPSGMNATIAYVSEGGFLVVIGDHGFARYRLEKF